MHQRNLLYATRNLYSAATLMPRLFVIQRFLGRSAAYAADKGKNG